MTTPEILVALLALLVIVSFAIASLVFVALAITELIEARRARRKEGGKKNECA